MTVARPALYVPADFPPPLIYRGRTWTERGIAMLAICHGAEWVQVEFGPAPWEVRLRCRATADVLDGIRAALAAERPWGWLIQVEGP